MHCTQECSRNPGRARGGKGPPSSLVHFNLADWHFDLTGSAGIKGELNFSVKIKMKLISFFPSRLVPMLVLVEVNNLSIARALGLYRLI